MGEYQALRSTTIRIERVGGRRVVIGNQVEAMAMDEEREDVRRVSSLLG